MPNQKKMGEADAKLHKNWKIITRDLVGIPLAMSVLVLPPFPYSLVVVGFIPHYSTPLHLQSTPSSGIFYEESISAPHVQASRASQQFSSWVRDLKRGGFMRLRSGDKFQEQGHQFHVWPTIFENFSFGCFIRFTC